jgi:hypothetical protein
LDASTPQRDRAAPRVREQPPSFGFRATYFDLKKSKG